MKKHQIFLLGYLLLLAFSSAQSEPIVPISKKPSWVLDKTPNLPVEIPKNDILSGTYYLLVDSQVKVDKPAPDYFFRIASYIVNQKGLEENSQINIDFDPTYEAITLHDVLIHRNGEKINKTNTGYISLLQREKELDRLIYNGEHTLNIILDDVRVGDIIEYSYTRSGDNPIFNGIFGYKRDLQWNVPVHHLHLRLLWNKSKPLNYKLINSDIEVFTKKTDKGTEYSLELTDIKPLILDGQTPPWFDPYGTIYFSEVSNWQEVKNWLVPLYENAIENHPTLEAITSKIRAKHKDKDTQITAALQFVQEEIRYLGIEIGQNSHKPSPASVTLERRFGDCKDKTVLFLSLLRALGINAQPVLVNTKMSKELAKVPPMINIFDHVIVKVEYEGKNYWLDPTRQHQLGNLKDIYQPEYGYGLVVDNSDSIKLSAIKIDQLQTISLIHDTFDLTAGAENHTIFSSDAEYGIYSAEQQRSTIATNGLTQLQDDYLEFYKDYYRSIESLEPVKFGNKPDSSRIISNEKYEITQIWEKNSDTQKEEAWFYPNAISPYLTEPEKITRTHPFKISHPININQIIDINLYKIDWQFDDESFLEDNNFFFYKRKVTYDKSSTSLKLTYTYKTKTDSIPPENIDTYIEAINKIKKQLDFGIYRKDKKSIATTAFLEKYFFEIVIGSIVFLILLILLLWRIDARRNPYEGEMYFYPISLIKLVAMWLLTFGVYSFYWFYRNWKYIKKRDDSNIMPIARGIFNQFWYYPLYKELYNDSKTRFGKIHLPKKAISACLAVLFFISSILVNRVAYAIPLLLLIVLITIPLANYINYANQNNKAAYAYNSRWKLRHYLLSILGIPLLLITFGSEIGLMSSETVVNGKKILSHDIKFMQRKGIINPGDEIIYFYSDGFFSLRSDGNGFTEKHVFSYWEDESGGFNHELASFDDIKDIDVTWAKSWDESTLIKVIRKDESSFLLFISSTEGKDKTFVKRLRYFLEKN